MQRIFALVNAPETQLWDKLGGVQAMFELIDVSSAEAETKVGPGTSTGGGRRSQCEKQGVVR